MTSQTTRPICGATVGLSCRRCEARSSGYSLASGDDRVPLCWAHHVELSALGFRIVKEEE